VLCRLSKLVAHCPDLWLRAMLETAYDYGWRVSELLNLRVCQVDLVARTIRLEPGTTKNQEGREVTIESGRLLELLRQCVQGKRPEDQLFTLGDKPIRDLRKSWENLCTADQDTISCLLAIPKLDPLPTSGVIGQVKSQRRRPLWGDLLPRLHVPIT
jgi:integrase